MNDMNVHVATFNLLLWYYSSTTIMHHCMLNNVLTKAGVVKIDYIH